MKMLFSTNKLYYSAMILQFALLIFFYFTRNCVTCGHDNYINTIRDYRLCANKMDSVLRDNRLEKAARIAAGKDSVKLETVAKQCTVHNKMINFTDTVKVSYVGKDGVSVVTNYPFHKVIVD